MSTLYAPNLEPLAASAFRFHKSQEAALRQRVNALCAIVNAHPDCDAIYSNLPIWDGELSGQEPSYSDLVAQEQYLTEQLEARQ